MTADQIRRIVDERVDERLAAHAARWVPGENVLRNAADAFTHDSLTAENIGDAVKELFAWARDLTARLPVWLQYPVSLALDWAQARVNTLAASQEVAARLLRIVAPLLRPPKGLPRGESPDGQGAGGAGAVGPDTRGHPPPGDPDLRPGAELADELRELDG